MFWNPENFFDYYNDSVKNDEEFLPYGMRAWDSVRYQKKLQNTYKVIMAAGEWTPPDIIGLCEIENRKVLFDLLRNTPFSFFNYRFVHHESRDRRGIDVALLYNADKLKLLWDTAIPVVFAHEIESRTRDILCARLLKEPADTLSLFVNHWPSKYGGAGITGDLREEAAACLGNFVCKTLNHSPADKIIIMGDFNDPPVSKAVLKLLSMQCIGTDSLPALINLASNYKGDVQGSYKFQGSWELLDQIMVSRNLLTGGEGLHVRPGSFRVFSPDYLFERDDKFGGFKPFRTYSGYTYSGGFSDHLPVLLDLYDGAD